MTPLNDALATLMIRQEIENLDVDIVNARVSLSLERFKNWAALLGPVMTAVTIERDRSRLNRMCGPIAL
jgi:hypothetical protein